MVRYLYQGTVIPTEENQDFRKDKFDMMSLEEIRDSKTDEELRRTRKFSVRLNEVYHELLTQIALREGRSKSEVFKRAIDSYVLSS